MTSASEVRLLGVHADLVARLRRVDAACAALGFTLLVTDGLRTLAEQQAAYASGRTAPGPIVTFRDGTTRRSNHQAHDDGLSHAVDCCFLVDGQPSWDARLPWEAYGACGEALGLVWGGRWTTPVDRPHLELPS